ncbi:MAG: hypothetical protein KDA79_19665 [Planctomycetaceae bacterium]|nr:hypothetical protein [Planctomycetaceae bacterium]
MSNAPWLGLMLVSSLLAAPQSAAGNDIEDFFKELLQGRQRYEQRRNDWQHRRDARYEGYRRDLPDDSRFDVEAPGLPEGTYSVPLPGGISINIRSKHLPDHREKQISEQVRQLGEAMRYPARRIAGSLRGSGDPRLRQESHEALEELEEMIEAASEEDIEDILEHHQRFDDHWRQVVYGLRGEAGDRQLRSFAERVARHDQQLHYVLHVGPGQNYDRPRLIGLTRRLEAVTRNLEEIVEENTGPRRPGQRLSRQAHRVSVQAHGLAETVADNQTYDRIVEEYREFDREWHDLLGDIRQNERFADRFLPVARDVRQIDRQLHDILLVDSPEVPDDNGAHHLVHRIAGTARLLEDEARDAARNQRGDQGYRFVRLADRFSSTAQQLDDQLERGEHLSRTTGLLERLQSDWQNVIEQFERIQRGRETQQVAQLLGDLRSDMLRLTRFSAGQKDWRYYQSND